MSMSEVKGDWPWHNKCHIAKIVCVSLCSGICIGLVTFFFRLSVIGLFLDGG